MAKKSSNKKVLTPFNFEQFKKGIAAVESSNGADMWSKTSTATGLYGQIYNLMDKDWLKKNNISSRKQFSENIKAQKDYMNRSLSGKMKGTLRNTSLSQDGWELSNEYLPQIDDFNFRIDEVTALSHFLGRQGTRNYFGWALRDGDVNKFSTWHKKKGANKTPEEYLQRYNEAIGRQRGLSSDKLPGRANFIDMNKKTKEELDQLGLGDWIRDNSQGVVGGLKTAAGIGAMFMGLPGVGAGLIGGGINDIGQGIAGNKLADQQAATESELLQANQLANYKTSKTQQLYNTANQNTNYNPQIMKYGGPINYTGQSHQGPQEGIPIDSQGNPISITNQKPVALVEGGEIAFNDPDTGEMYVMPKDRQKEVAKVFKDAETRLGKDFNNPDPITKEGLTRALRKLIATNETNKAKFGKGGNMNKMAGGGFPEDPTRYNIPGVTITGQGNPFNYQGYGAPGAISQGINPSYGAMGIPQSYGIGSRQPQLAGYAPALGGGDQTLQDTASAFPNNSIDPATLGVAKQNYSLSGSGIAKESINSGTQPWSPFPGQALGIGIQAGLGALGNVMLAKNRPRPEHIKPSLVTSPNISNVEQRIQADVDATESRARIRSGARATGASKANMQALINQGDASITGKTGALKSQSMMQERNINRQGQFQAQLSNQQSVNRTNQLNAVRTDQFNRDNAGIYSQAINNVTGGIGDMTRAYQDSAFMKTLGSRSGYELVKDENGNIRLAPIPGYWENKVNV